ncbi:MAG: hypothetical protein DWQ11_18705 [Proteobacteria bacterium]|nr:MAG: hypothetical protein DWQ11_18705 [Pseudomonadota bacterium]
MSLEKALADNTAAIRELIEAIKAGVPTTVAQVAAVVTEAKSTAAEKTKVDASAKAEAEKPETLTQMTASEAQEALQGHANQPAKAPTYQDAADAVTKLARSKGRDAAVSVLAAEPFKAAKLPDVKPEHFAALITACEEAGA